MTSIRRLRILLVSALLLIAANIAFFQLVTRPWNRKVLDLGQLEVERQARIAAEKAANDQLLARKNSLASTLSDVTYFFDRMVVGEKEGYDRVRRALQTIADDAGIKIDAVNYAIEDSKQWQLQSMSLSFQVTGSYDQIRTFLRGIEKAPVFLFIDSIDLSAAGQEAETVSLNLRLSTLFRRPA